MQLLPCWALAQARSLAQQLPWLLMGRMVAQQLLVVVWWGQKGLLCPHRCVS